MRPINKIDPSHRLSLVLDDGKGPPRVSTGRNDGQAKNKKSFPKPKKGLESQKLEK